MNDNTPSVATLVRKWAPKIEDRVELIATIRREHPWVTPAMVIDELWRQAMADFREADKLKDSRRI